VSLALLGGVFPATGAAQSLIGTGQTLDGEPTCAGLPVTINMQLGDSGLGTNGDDVILGTDGNDVIRGYIGNDIICGGGGDDSIYAGYGQDRVFGEAGADTIWGGYGVDELRGGDGNDRMYGGDGIDELYGDDGQDRLYGNGDGDRIEGGPGNDYLRGGSGDDTLDGVAGRNFIIGGSGSDTIDGGPENDRIFGSTGADFINGQGGNDFLRGNEGDDWLSGGDGDDLMYGSAGHDVMNGGVGDDGLYGGDGDDELAGFTGFDVCSGNDGFDTSLDCERNSFIEELTSTPPVGVGPDGCLQNSTVEQVDTTWLAGQFIGRIRPGHVGTGTAIDLRTTTVSVHDASQDQIVDGRALVDSRWGLVQLDSSIDLCVVGGEITSPNPYNVTWLENYDTDPRKLGYGYRLGTTRNHTAIDLGDAVRPVINGMYFFNLHDGPRFNDASDWRLEHSWGEYTRDDCVENDRMASGVIYDTLFDGCYTGYSNRPTDPTVSGIANSVTFDRVLLRMELMPGLQPAVPLLQQRTCSVRGRAMRGARGVWHGPTLQVGRPERPDRFNQSDVQFDRQRLRR